MADDDEWTHYPGLATGGEAPSDESPTWGDYGKSVAASVTGAGASFAGLTRRATDDSDTSEGRFTNAMSKVLQKSLGDTTDELNASRTESARTRAEAAVTSKEFWDHPLSSGTLKVAGMAGSMAAMIFSGGVVGAAIVGGALGAGEYDTNVDKLLDKATDDKLKDNEYYAGLRSMGMSEEDARVGLKSKIIGNKELFNFAVGAVQGALGPAGKIAAGVAGKAAVGLAGAETGVAARAGLGALEGAAAEGAQGGVSNATFQSTEMEVDPKKKFDTDSLVDAFLTEGFMGGVMGGAVGAATGKRRSKTPEKVSDGAEAPNQRPQEQGSGIQNTPVEATPPGASQEADVGITPTSVPDPVAQAVGKKPKLEATVVDPIGPAPDQALAIADVQQKVVPATPEVPPEVAAASARVAQPEPSAAPVESASPAEVPPGVAAASQRVGVPEIIPEVTPEVMPAPIPEQPPVSSVAAPSPGPAPEPVPPAPRVLKDMSAEGRANAKAVSDKAKADLKAANATAKEVGVQKSSAHVKKTTADRATHAEEIFNEHVKTDLELPTTKEARAAMAADLGKMLTAAADRGLVPRESMPALAKGATDAEVAAHHLSIPQKVGDAAMSPHVRYLREAMAVKKILEGKKYGPQSKERARVLDFITEQNAKDLDALAERRKVDGAAAKAIHQGDVEAPSGKVADAMAAAEPNESTMSPEDRLLAKEIVDESDGPTDPVQFEKDLASAPKAELAEQGKHEALVEKAADKKFNDAVAARVAASKARASANAPKKSSPDAIRAAVKASLAAKKAKRPEHIDARLTDSNTPKDATTGEPVNVIHTTTAKKALEALNLSHLDPDGVPHALAKFAQRRFAAMAGDTLVHTVDKAEMGRALGDLSIAFQADGKGDVGLNRLSLDGSGGYVLVRADAASTPAQRAHVVLHEVAHAATMRALVENPQIHSHVVTMMGEVKAYMRALPRDMAGKMEYAMTNPREFIAEAFSNPEVQEILSHIPASDRLSSLLRLDRTHRLSVWDAVVSIVRSAIEMTTGRLPEGHRMIEAVMRIGDHIAKENAITKELAGGKHLPINRHGLSDTNLDARLTRQEATDAATDTLTNTRGKLRRIKDTLSSTFMMKERNNDTFGPSRPLNRIFDLRAMQEREKDNILNAHGGSDVVRKIAELERSHPEAMAKASDLIFDASNSNVNLGPGADNAHLGKNATKGWQGKKMLPELQRRYDALAKEAPEVAALLHQSVKFFRDIHNEVSMATIKNVLEVAGIKDSGLAERIFKDGVNDADRATFGEKSGIVSALNAATNLKELKGWYAPFRRYGDFISTGEHELSVPKGALKINSNTIQFYDTNKARNARAVKAYVEQDSHTPEGNRLTNTSIQKVWVDAKDHTQLADKSDINSVQAYRVRMQTQHTEFHATEAEAGRNQTSLAEGGLRNTSVAKREDAHRSSPGMEGALGTVIRSLEHTESYKKLESGQQLAVRQALLNASVRSMSSTNIKTSMAHRQNVAGMSRDLGRVAADYAHMTSNYLAQLRFRPKIDSVFAEMRAYMTDHKYDGDRLRREEVYQEFQSRIYGAADQLAQRPPNTAIRKLLQISRLARLAGVSFHVINSQEPWTTSMPVIGGRHGFTQTSRAMLETYNMIGARGGILAGLKDIGRAYTNDSGFTDYVKVFKDNIAKSNTMGGAKAQRLMDMLDYMNARNLYGNDAVFEVGKFADPNSNVAARALDRADLMANQVGSAIEAINRSVTGLTAYELEFKKNGGNHEAAMHYAYTTAHTTMGDYSSWNAAPVFNTRGGQLALQFKKFGHKTYYLLGKTMQGVIAGDREAMKQFAGLMVTHAMVAGVLGLPTEPFKVALMAANLTGMTGFTPEDFDNSVRQLMARLAGAKGGEIISKGLYRGLGIEVSGRMGLDSLFTYGNPKSEKANDLKAWLFDTMAGAPAGYLLDQVAAAQALAKGDIGTAIAKASPVRVVSDVTKAVTGAMGPKLSPAGREQRAALTPYQTAVRTLGFTPSTVAEDGAMRGHVASEGSKLSGSRSGLINDWVTASGAKKVAAQRAVQKWNAGQPKDVQITAKDLASAAKRRETEEENGTVKNGISISKRTKAIYDRAASTYNP